MQKRNIHRGGFTLLEVMLVLMILGMLVTVAIFTIGGQDEKAKENIAGIQVLKIESAIGLYKSNIGEFPSEDTGGLEALTTKPSFDDEAMADKWAGPYLKTRDLKDPWGQLFNYEVLDAGESDQFGGSMFKVWSNGPDKQSGNEDDVNNWEEAAE